MHCTMCISVNVNAQSQCGMSIVQGYVAKKGPLKNWLSIIIVILICRQNQQIAAYYLQ